MTNRTLSTAAQAARMIRQELKKNGVSARVKSKTYNMGSSVDVTLHNPLPATLKAIREYCGRFEYGHFDGMTDCYHMSNVDESIPQTRHVFVNAEYSDELQQEAYLFLRNYRGGWEEFSENFSDNATNWVGNGSYNVREAVWRTLTGADSNSFWSQYKPRQKAV